MLLECDADYLSEFVGYKKACGDGSHFSYIGNIFSYHTKRVCSFLCGVFSYSAWRSVDVDFTRCCFYFFTVVLVDILVDCFCVFYSGSFCAEGYDIGNADWILYAKKIRRKRLRNLWRKMMEESEALKVGKLLIVWESVCEMWNEFVEENAESVTAVNRAHSAVFSVILVKFWVRDDRQLDNAFFKAAMDYSGKEFFRGKEVSDFMRRLEDIADEYCLHFRNHLLHSSDTTLFRLIWQYLVEGKTRFCDVKSDIMNDVKVSVKFKEIMLFCGNAVQNIMMTKKLPAKTVPDIGENVSECACKKTKFVWFQKIGDGRKIMFYFSLASMLLLLMAVFTKGANPHFWIFRKWPDGFYTLLRIVTCTALVGKMFEKFPAWMKFICVIGAILYNPLVIVHFEKDEWCLLNLITFFVLLTFEVWLMVARANKNGSSETR